MWDIILGNLSFGVFFNLRVDLWKEVLGLISLNLLFVLFKVFLVGLKFVLYF